MGDNKSGITPPESSIGSLFTGVSPGPMTLVSSLFPENECDNDYRTFSQLLSGAISPAAVPNVWQNFAQSVPETSSGRNVEFIFQQNRPAGLVVSQQPAMFTIPPGLSPASLLDSPAFIASSQVYYQAFSLISSMFALVG